MATVTAVLARTAFATTEGQLYMTPTATTSVVTNIVVTNTSNSPATFNILLDDVELFSNTPIQGNGTISVDMKQVLEGLISAKEITGFASATSVKVHISGVELS
jgi:hypothetical protein